MNSKTTPKLPQELAALVNGFAQSQKLLTAIGDETRQHIILEMIKMDRCQGVRVGEITAQTNLSRPAVSHHLKILKEAQIITMRREGTKNFYHFNPNTAAFRQLIATLQLADEILTARAAHTADNDI